MGSGSGALKIRRRSRRRFLRSAAAATAAATAPRIAGSRDGRTGWAGVIGDDDMAHGHRLRPGGKAPPAPAVGPAVLAERCAVIVVGAGIAGLAAARALRQAGIDDYVVLDLGREPGGNSRSSSMAGLPCPLGAHYLPVPGPAASEVVELLIELGVRDRDGAHDERMLVHAPQERLLIHGVWQEGLLPMVAQPAATLDQYRRFADEIARLQGPAFTIPVARAGSPDPALTATTFGRWLADRGFDAPGLRWFLDYCCRDDYGAGVDTVSAWAGLHYFASRHGFALPDAMLRERSAPATAAREPMLTWPEGNGWLAGRIARPHADRLRTRHLVTAIQRDGSSGRWLVDALDLHDPAAPRQRRWLSARVICAAPLHVAARLVAPPAPEAAWLAQACRSLRSAPWLGANVLVDADWRPSGGDLWWDNVIYGSSSLGYVDARHQRLDRIRGPSLLTWYQALGDQPDARAWLAAGTFDELSRRVVDDLARAHPEIGRYVREVALRRWGHAMAIPTPSAHHDEALARLRNAEDGLVFAHSDLSLYSVCEEAMARGTRAGRICAQRLRGR